MEEKKAPSKIFRYQNTTIMLFFRNGTFFPPPKSKTLVALETSSQGVTLKYGFGVRGISSLVS